MKTWTENSRNFGWNQAKKKKLSWEKKQKKIHVWNQVIFSLKLFFLVWNLNEKNNNLSGEKIFFYRENVKRISR